MQPQVPAACIFDEAVTFSPRRDFLLWAADYPHSDRFFPGTRTDQQHQRPAYRLYEVQNGNHIETYKDTFPQLELIQPHAQDAFDLLVKYVEHGAELPPNQCTPRSGSIAAWAGPWPHGG